MLLYGKVFALYWLGFWYCTAVCCNLCSWYLIGTSLDFIVVYRGHCNFVKGEKIVPSGLASTSSHLSFQSSPATHFTFAFVFFHFIPHTPHYALAHISHAAYISSFSLLAPCSCSPAPFVHSYFIIV